MKFGGILALTATVVVAVGCSMTLSVNGAMESGDETFTGTATGYMNGGGTLSVTTNKGLSCSGDFVYVTRRFGEGIFKCSDGRSGPFDFVSTGTSGTGKGRLGGELFTFTFGL